MQYAVPTITEGALAQPLAGRLVFLTVAFWPRPFAPMP
jgi:hypothetical protein